MSGRMAAALLAGLSLLASGVAGAARPDARAAGLATRLSLSGEQLWRAGRFDAAGEAWALAVAAHPAEPGALAGLARHARGRFDDAGARALLERGLALTPDDRALARDLGLLLLRRDPHRAAELLERYLARPPAGDAATVVDAARAVARHLALTIDPGPGSVPALPEAFSLPLEVARRTLRVEASIGRATALLVLDSGTNKLSLETSVAHRLGLAGMGPALSHGLGGVGRVPAALTDVARLRLGPLELLHLPALIGSFRTPAGADGLLPLRLLEGYRVGIDAARGTLALRRGAGTRASRAGPGVPLWRVGSLLAVNGRIGSAAATFVIDTGATAHVLARQRVAALVGPRVLAAAQPVAVEGVAGETPAVVLDLPEPIRLGDHTVAGQRALVLELGLVSELAGVDLDGLIGVDLVLASPVVLDLATGWLGLGPEPPAR